MSNTQNTNFFNQQLSNANNDSTENSLISDMVAYSSSLESTINDHAEAFDFTTIQSSSLKRRIDQLDAPIIEELGALFYEFLTYIIVFEKVLYYSVESFQSSSELSSSDADHVVSELRKKRKSKIPPAASLPPRPKPSKLTELSLSQILPTLNQLSEEFSPAFFTFLVSFIELLEVLEYVETFLETNRTAIDNENLNNLNELSRDMVIYTMSMLPQVSGLNTPQVFGNHKSQQFSSTLSSLQNSIDSQLYTAFQSFLNYIESQEN